MQNNLIDISEASQRLGVTIATLRRWDTSGKLKSVRTFGNHRRYRLEEIEALVNPTDDTPSTRKKAFIYCRVSTKKQQESGNLQRQRDRLILYCQDKHYTVVTLYEEVASGLNDHRRELTKLFKNFSNIDVIVVEYADRLARFGYAYLKEFAEAFNVEIETVEQGVKLQPNEEMVNDLVSIVTCFGARLYGARGGRKLTQTIVQTIEKLEQDRGEPDENDAESDSGRPHE
ncbi:MAG: IS607 family transposase [Desulfosporosinus sp.]|nr:IS607 family transposase [Desulfosporosinus sp.]